MARSFTRQVGRIAMTSTSENEADTSRYEN